MTNLEILTNSTMADTYYFVYIVLCADSTFYCGITTDLDRRVAEHNGIPEHRHGVCAPKGKGAKYTSMRRPVAVVYSAQFQNRSEASIEEHRIKSLTRNQKEQIIQNNAHVEEQF